MIVLSIGYRQQFPIAVFQLKDEWQDAITAVERMFFLDSQLPRAMFENIGFSEISGFDAVDDSQNAALT